MNNKYQEQAIKLSNSQVGEKACKTCGAPCMSCASHDESNEVDERFNETPQRSTSELTEKGNKPKRGRFEEK